VGATGPSGAPGSSGNLLQILQNRVQQPIVAGSVAPGDLMVPALTLTAVESGKVFVAFHASFEATAVGHYAVGASITWTGNPGPPQLIWSTIPFNAVDGTETFQASMLQEFDAPGVVAGGHVTVLVGLSGLAPGDINFSGSDATTGNLLFMAELP
jgi:hypothetical protein